MQTLILNHYPPVIKQIREMQQIAKTEDIEFSKLNTSIKEVIRNMFVLTADESGVQRFEKLLSITAKASQSLDDRKLYIISKMNRCKMSLSELKVMLLSCLDEIDLSIDCKKNTLTVTAGSGISNIGMIYKILDDFMPLHVYIFFIIEVIFDNRDVENLIFHRLVFHITFPFWRCRVFDGAWLLDGSVIMDQKRCYGLAVRLASCMSIKMPEGIRCAIRTVMAGAAPVEMIGCRVFQRLSVRQQETVKENVKFLAGIDGMTERIGEAEVITKTPDYWLLDGSVMLDGSRKLDSIYYKETIE